MTKIGNMQKIMISLDIFAKEKSFLNWPENLPLKYQALVSGHPVYECMCCTCNIFLLEACLVQKYIKMDECVAEFCNNSSARGHTVKIFPRDNKRRAAWVKNANC